MNFKEAINLAQNQTIYHKTLKNSDGTAQRFKVTSIKTWKRAPKRVEVRVKRGTYEFHRLDLDDLEEFTTNEP